MDLTLDQEIWFKVTEHPLPITTTKIYSNTKIYSKWGDIFHNEMYWTNITRGDINPLYSIIS